MTDVKVLAELERAILDEGQYSKLLTEINNYYSGLLTAILLNRKEQDIKSDARRNQTNNIIKPCMIERK